MEKAPELFITPAIKDAGWDQIRREVTSTPGPVVVRGNMSLQLGFVLSYMALKAA
ncbi:MAG: type I site-specific restriction endonuclease [Zhongshania marina]|jgi:type I site-specific restriction endonuclease